MTAQDEKVINKGILLNKSHFLNAGGLFSSVYTGKITEIAQTFHSNTDEFS